MKRPTILISALILISTLGGGAADNWPEFRGPNGNGHSDARGLPLTWSETNHVKWKTPIHGRAWSSPVIWDKQIWLTTATEDGRQLFAVCVDRDTGRVIHDLKLYEVEKPQFAHKFNSHASPTPVIEAGRVYVTFGATGTACLDAMTGKVLWERRDFVCNHFRGAGSSPILSGDLLIMNFDGSDHQFIVALNKKTGQTAWKQDRSIDYKDLDASGKPEADGDWRKAFSTPHVGNVNGQPLLISQGAKAVYGYEPRSGKELWRVEERTSHSGSARPLSDGETIYVNTGWSTGQILALRPGKAGEVLDANASASNSTTQLALLWKSKRSVPRKPSLLLIGGLLYGVLDEGGLVSCLDAKSGNEVWRERIGGNYSASPIHADGRIYFCGEDGRTVVLAAGREFRKLAENKLDDGFMASPTVSGQALFLRSRTHLYRIEE